MSREIKFRAWSPGIESTNPAVRRAFGEWVSPPQMLYDEKPGDCLMWKSQGQNLQVMQYTGLHDKNGKEIYEGDVISDSFGGRKGRIKYNIHIAAFEIADYDGIHTLTSHNSEKFFEVIGNIHENPELIEEATQ